MKRKFVKTILSLTVAAAVGMTSPAALMAAQTETEAAQQETDTVKPETEASQSGAETEKDADKKDEPAADFEITLEDGKVTVKNQTTRTIAKVEMKQAEPEKKDKEAQTEEKFWELILTEESGDTHTFSKVEADKWKEPVLVDEYGFLYVKYQDENGKQQEALETADEKKFDQPLTMYVSTNVNIRKDADKESESLKVSALGEEWKVVAAVPGWLKVESDAVTGYAYHSYLTEDKASVEAALKAKQEAEAAAAAQAAAQAQAEAEAAAAQAAADAAEAEQSQPQEVYEVSREAFDDCDGSGHGYYEITYSDGSVAYEDY